MKASNDTYWRVDEADGHFTTFELRGVELAESTDEEETRD